MAGVRVTLVAMQGAYHAARAQDDPMTPVLLLIDAHAACRPLMTPNKVIVVFFSLSHHSQKGEGTLKVYLSTP